MELIRLLTEKSANFAPSYQQITLNCGSLEGMLEKITWIFVSGFKGGKKIVESAWRWILMVKMLLM